MASVLEHERRGILIHEILTPQKQSLSNTIRESPLVALMRECIDTPRRLLSDDDRDCHLPSARRTGPRSERRHGHAKLVAFDLPAKSPSKELPLSSKRRLRTFTNTSPSRVLAVKDENARPVTADGAKLGSKLNSLSVQSDSAVELKSMNKRNRDLLKQMTILEQQLGTLQDNLEDRDTRIVQLTRLVQFLATEVNVYTSTLEDEVEQQRAKIQQLEKMAAGAYH
ncbi:hypothetical protein BCR37DRAFT_394105 [Protomyces lactucae-debilis]|uniref:Uncharacterized protein n=1 Tax=Protomyces lactucae-debilis TaxID=2754530 RepID=A0A1Y2F863_PROLT|nr:uncharacterized protein BCR37DRAFT_394105 [Protomyces lactucae-debilis]ORY80049.1 hypothetical protein BCR37DRAFT_394105 [Protomyces lactucae-debilis]